MTARRTAPSQIVFLIILASAVLDVRPAPARDPAVTGAIRKLYPQQGDRIPAGTSFQCGYDVGPIKVVEKGDHEHLTVWTYAKVRTAKDRQMVYGGGYGSMVKVSLKVNWLSHEISGNESPVTLPPGRYEYEFVVLTQFDDDTPYVLDARTVRFRVVENADPDTETPATKTPRRNRESPVTGSIRKLSPQQGDRIAAGTRFQCGYDVGPIKVVERGDHKLLDIWTYAKVRTVKDRRVVYESRGGASTGIQLDKNWISHELSGRCSPVELEAGRYEYVFIVVAQLDDEAPIILDVRTERFRVQ